MIRVLNNDLGRALHASLYIRLLSFCQQHTPEVPGDSIVQMWMSRVYNGDLNLHILVDLDDNYNIVGHAVIDVQDVYGTKIALCHQVQGEKNSVIALRNGAEYMDKLALEAGVTCTVVYVTKHNKALEKEYGYKVSRTVMIKKYGEDDDN